MRPRGTQKYLTEQASRDLTNWLPCQPTSPEGELQFPSCTGFTWLMETLGAIESPKALRSLNVWADLWRVIPLSEWTNHFPCMEPIHQGGWAWCIFFSLGEMHQSLEGTREPFREQQYSLLIGTTLVVWAGSRLITGFLLDSFFSLFVCQLALLLWWLRDPR